MRSLDVFSKGKPHTSTRRSARLAARLGTVPPTESSHLRGIVPLKGPSALSEPDIWYHDDNVTTRRILGIAVLGMLPVAAVACSSGPSISSTTTTSAPMATSTTSIQSATSTAVWPMAANATRYQTPEAAAKGFATDYLHMVGPVIGQFQQGDSRSGEVAIRPKASGPVTTVLVRQLTNDRTWWVLGAATANITITEPKTLATITSPVALSGTSTAYEATVNISLRPDDTAKPLVETTVMGGANGQMGPFSATLPFAAPTSSYGALVMYTISAMDGTVAEATVIRVQFASSPDIRGT